MDRRYSPLFDTLCRYLFDSQKPNKENFIHQVFHEPLTLELIELKGLRFLSDLSHTIQFILPNPNLEQRRPVPGTTPNNSLETIYYPSIVKGKYQFWEPYNCRMQIINFEQQAYFRPDSLQYLLGDFYYEFKCKKNDLKVRKLPSRTIKLFQWKIKIGNITRTGWYAPAIESVRYKIEEPTDFILAPQLNFAGVTLVLYEKCIKELMEQMRLDDLRKKYVDEKDRHGGASMLYFMVKTKQNSYKSSLISIDKRQQKLNFNPDQKFTIIPFSKWTGTATLSQKLSSDAIDTKKIKQRQYKQWQILMPVLKTEEQNQKNNRSFCDLWDDDEDDNEIEEPAYEKKKEVVIDDDNVMQEQSSEDDDILKKLYQAQLGINKMRIG